MRKRIDIMNGTRSNQVADAFRERRVNGTLLDLDGVLCASLPFLSRRTFPTDEHCFFQRSSRLNAEAVASGWNSLFSVIRDNNSIPADLRELLVSWNFRLRFGIGLWTTWRWDGDGMGWRLPWSTFRLMQGSNLNNLSRS